MSYYKIDNLEQYFKHYNKSIREPRKFWGKVASENFTWYQEWEMTMAQNDEWQTWGAEFIRKNLRLNKQLAKREMAMIGLMWGLKFSDWTK